MTSILLITSFLIGYLGASIQLNPRPLPLRRRLFWLLGLIIILALGVGYLFYLSGKIDARGLYLLLISAGDTAGVLIVLERWLQKHWPATLLAAAAIGLINLYFVQRHFAAGSGLALALGVIAGLGYLTNGLIRKRWRGKP